MTYKAACTILNIGFCLNLLVAEAIVVGVVNFVVDGIAVAVVDFAVILVVVGSVVVVGGPEAFLVGFPLVLAGKKSIQNSPNGVDV